MTRSRPGFLLKTFLREVFPRSTTFQDGRNDKHRTYRTFHGKTCCPPMDQPSVTNLSSSPGNTRRLGGLQGATSHDEVGGYADAERIHFSHSLVIHLVQSGVMCCLEHLGLAGTCASQTRDGHHAHHSHHETS